MSTNSNSIYLSIIGKPNSGKSTLFNCFLGSNLSPVGNEYGLTKNLYKAMFNYKTQDITIVDTPGLRRQSKVIEKNEIERNSKVLKLINDVEVIILLIDSLEDVTKQDFKLADISINRKKIVFFLFNKIDLVNNEKNYKLKINKYFKNNYSKYNMINIDFISAKQNFRVSKILSKIIIKKKLARVLIQKSKLNNFIVHLDKKGNYPKIKNISVKPKYIVQTASEFPKFKIFINSKEKAPPTFQKFFDNAFRNFFKLSGIPIDYKFISSKNPYAS